MRRRTRVLRRVVALAHRADATRLAVLGHHGSVATVASWADVVALLTLPLSPENNAGGLTEDLRLRFGREAEMRCRLGTRFIHSDASGFLAVLERDGITQGPIVEAIAAATSGIPGVGTTAAVALAVKLAARRTRELGFGGRAPRCAVS
jgi:Mrp family chromosome partitioning ATPase